MYANEVIIKSTRHRSKYENDALIRLALRYLVNYDIVISWRSNCSLSRSNSLYVTSNIIFQLTMHRTYVQLLSTMRALRAIENAFQLYRSIGLGTVRRKSFVDVFKRYLHALGVATVTHG